MRVVKGLLRPDLGKYQLGTKGFLAWGPMWGSHYDEKNNWTRGQVNGQGQHDGMDFLIPRLESIYCPCAGKVLIAGPDKRWPAYGNMVQIELDIKPYTLLNLAHFEDIVVKVGQIVRPMELLGLCGATGNTGTPPAPHCHAGLRGEHGEPLPGEWLVPDHSHFSQMG